MSARLGVAMLAAAASLALAPSVAAAQACPVGQTRTCVQRTRMQPAPNTIYTCNTHLRSCQRSKISKDVPVTDTVCRCSGGR